VLENILYKHFAPYFSLNILMKMFIINGKSHCCNNTFTDFKFTLLLAKII